MSDLITEERLELLSVEELEKQFKAKSEATAKALTETPVKKTADAPAETLAKAPSKVPAEEMAEAPTEATDEETDGKTSEAKSEPMTEANAEVKLEPKVEANLEAKPELKAEVQIELRPEVIPETHSEVLSEAPSEAELVELAEYALLETDNEIQFEELHDPILECPESPIVAQECSICLDEITELCYPNACNHMFCFPCLRNWSKVS